MDLEVRDANASDCLSRNESDRGPDASSGGMSTALASVLIFTIVVDILGNVLVILSVYRNKKLRNAGAASFGDRGPPVSQRPHPPWITLTPKAELKGDGLVFKDFL
ncbi:unnamed protein product [Pleuronectes platessa]|uniref:Uncharacterized protein n=1 Tax=Pleuronectes platessa TaxID=8262 RepID=A0A9N7YFV4_PLEPL|nr:unnamed protein product [Pleuronectes platessa]